MTSSTVSFSEDDRRFLNRIENGIQTVQSWDADPTLLQECRWLIPWDELRDDGSKYSRQEVDAHLIGNAILLQRLCRFFKETMTWINKPECIHCGCNDCILEGTRGPETVEEREGGASRVEVYKCPQCSSNSNDETKTTTTTFPRYNSVRKLLETQCGRCGEYANLFGLYCRAVGFETRYILDVTDHVWTEVYLIDQDQWIMADGCEGIINEPSMYEKGWGKQGLCYMIGIAIDHVVDVTPRYTRKWKSDPNFQLRRRSYTSSEQVSTMIIEQVNRQLSLSSTTTNNKARLAELERRQKLETAEFQRNKLANDWTHQDTYGCGRISGSLAWKLSRSEAGKDNKEDSKKDDGENTTDNNNKQKQIIAGFQIEPFLPPLVVSATSSKGGGGEETSMILTICAKPPPPPFMSSSVGGVGCSSSSSRHGSILVSNVACAVAEPKSISVVVLDEVVFGCILQSRCFETMRDVDEFVRTLPQHRIVICNGTTSKTEKEETSNNDGTFLSLSTRLGGWKDGTTIKDGFIYIGQVDAHPDWSFWSTWTECPTTGHEVKLEFSTSSSHRTTSTIALRTEYNTLPNRVATRLPETVMPVATQLLASEEQKRKAFLSFMGGSSSSSTLYSGYTTKPGAPVYLLDGTAYPFKRMGTESLSSMSAAAADAKGNWNTFHYLPKALVPVDDKGIVETKKKDGPNFEVPLELDAFTRLIGSQLLVTGNELNSTAKTLMPTQQALQNVRLVGFYFSAHWCGPCRSFTPMLAEMYQHLKEVYPTHGLEIVFVSSDRDQTSFQGYFGTMPWLAIPFEVAQNFKQQLDMIYGVRGIPTLVVLDAVSGNVVIPGSQSRNEVVMACRGGDLSIETMMATWLERVPPETIEIVSMLELSCKDDGVEEPSSGNDDENNPYLKRNETVVKSGMTLEPGPLDGKAIGSSPALEHDQRKSIEQAVAHVTEWNESSTPDAVTTILSTALKYLDHAIKEPWTPKFRTFRLSNKVADRITRIEGGVGLLQALGFEVFCTDNDFMATIPLIVDLDSMKGEMSRLLERLNNK